MGVFLRGPVSQVSRVDIFARAPGRVTSVGARHSRFEQKISVRL
jgi:hypothetical protein